jgi:YesN/AraC family two-component response regulator
MNDWRVVSGYGGIYEVSNEGSVRSLPRTELVFRPDLNKTITRSRKGNQLAPKEDNKGYLVVHLRNKEIDKESWVGIHRLVASAFVDNHLEKSTVNHLDGNKKNNRVKNLEWATNKEQTKHAYENNLMKVRGNTLYDVEFKKEITQFHKDTNLSFNKIAKHFSLSPQSVSRIVRNLWGNKRNKTGKYSCGGVK